MLLNECLEKRRPCKICHGCSCQTDRFRPVILRANIDKAFLETCMKEIDRNYLRFHWVNGPDDDHVVHKITVWFDTVTVWREP